MIGDIFVGALLLISGFINVLAIGAFWITPSLRTTANRFVINLLLVNFISCLILSPFAFNVNANSPTTIASSTNSYNASKLGAVLENKTSTECSNHTLNCIEIPAAESGNIDGHKIHLLETIENFPLRKYQAWSLDLVVAMSVLSVLLVILDTFVAVTDPLRYHARISDCKAWLLIALCWLLSITFGIASVLRTAEGNFDDDVIDSDNGVYHQIFLYTYFLLIIVTPFLLVILMYWRIYTEARESGQRMRQNGSSPLLQSALNLAATANAHQQHSSILTNPQCVLLMSTSPVHVNKQHHQHQPLIVSKQLDVNDGLTMRIDKQDYCVINTTTSNSKSSCNNNNNNNLNLNINNRMYSDTKTFLLSSPPHECIPMLTGGDDEEAKDDMSKSQQHQNILLTLTTVCDQSIKRNHSVKHLLTESELSGVGNDGKIVEMRQVQSTPNLHVSESSDFMTTPSNNNEQTLELPSIQASPKALRYMTSLRHRLSNASSLFKYREEGRAARISILVVIMFLITYLPYGILTLVHGHESIIKESNFALLSIIFVLLANLISPIIFAYRNKRVRRGMRRLLGVDKKTNERLEKLNSLKRSCSTRIKNYRQNNLHKSFNLGNIKGGSSNSTGGIKASNIRRTKSFMTCNYLTPPDAAAKCRVHLSPIHHSQSQHPLNGKEKKSILKIVADSSRKFRCQFTNCQIGLNQESALPAEV